MLKVTIISPGRGLLYAWKKTPPMKKDPVHRRGGDKWGRGGGKGRTEEQHGRGVCLGQRNNGKEKKQKTSATERPPRRGNSGGRSLQGSGRLWRPGDVSAKQAEIGGRKRVEKDRGRGWRILE